MPRARLKHADHGSDQAVVKMFNGSHDYLSDEVRETLSQSAAWLETDSFSSWDVRDHGHVFHHNVSSFRKRLIHSKCSNLFLANGSFGL